MCTFFGHPWYIKGAEETECYIGKINWSLPYTNTNINSREIINLNVQKNKFLEENIGVFIFFHRER